MKQAFFFWLYLVVFPAYLFAQTPDSGFIKKDSLQILPVIDSIATLTSVRPVFKFENKLLNSTTRPVSLSVQFKQSNSKDYLFYLIAAMVLLLAFIKYFYSRYFANLFRVFFNSSLRQNQLTDQLLQAKLPSLFFNIFFTISAGLYVYMLLLHYKLIDDDNRSVFILSSVALLALIYLVKFCTLKFTGWVTGLKEITNTYVFVIFLINKIIGILLVPFIIILAFSEPVIVKIAAIISLMSIGVLLLLRFFKSYGLLQNQLKISRFHFVLYILGIELLPLLLIYKGLMFYLSKNL